MKRLFYFVLLLASVGAGVYFIMFSYDAILYEQERELASLILGGTFPAKFDADSIFLYATALFVLLDTALVLMMLLMWVICLFRLSEVHKFYRLSFWYLIISLVFSAGYVYSQLMTTAGLDFAKVPWEYCVPTGSALAMCVLGFIFHITDKRS